MRVEEPRCLFPELEGTALPHIHGADRHKVLLFPPSLDEYITEDNPVRFIDAFVDQLDLQALGFQRAVAVAAQHKLIVEHAVTNAITDQGQLSPMALQTKQTLEVETLEVVIDMGYYDGEEVKACLEAGITPYIRSRVARSMCVPFAGALPGHASPFAP
jgi:hypothetical protein